MIIYVENSFLYFQYDDFLTQFKIILVLIIYEMQLFEFRFTGFTLK